METTPEEPRRYFVRTFGCQMNEHDSERIAGLLEADGLVAATSADDADVVVLNTCCIRENADNRLYGTLGHLASTKRAKPGMQIAVAGCLAQKDRDLIQTKAPYVDAVFGTHNVGRAAELLREAAERGPITEILEESEAFPSALPVKRDVSYAAWVTIQIGCDNSCAFCIVPSVRGKEISRPIDELVAEVAGLVEQGVTEVTLLGQNVNSYGRDLTRRSPLFAQLLREIGAIDGLRRIRFTSPHPKDMRPDVFEAMAEVPAVCNHLHFPLQSGSDRVLAAMHRGYNAARYLDKVRQARATIDDLAITSDIIVGFPGETDDDFARTLEVASEVSYDSCYPFIFSPRTGTEAATMTEHFVPEDVVADRFERLQIVLQRSALAKHEERVGKVETVLVEGPSARHETRWSARTGQNKLVHFEKTSGVATGAYADVRVTHAARHHLLGEVVEVTASPKHKTRIPVAVI
ncbi:MAG: tRNA (N6-isopentenyl adenosine(37)-C2)-methylthiotransferase MiaB [Acidimicrobiales bacterium]|nr:tRNA (N6-isopentenyl adenosine(37)-C2)-methylthiotransferase MiaB [Acidimicrobiales bacterium]